MTTCHACGAQAPATASFCPACGADLETGVAPHLKERSSAYKYHPHPHIEKRKRLAPKPKEAPVHGPGMLNRFNAILAVKITNGVGTMWCAYLFAAIALISLPDAIRGGIPTLVAWIAQTFLQLVLLSIIIVGQKVAGADSEKRAADTYDDVGALLAEVKEIHQHLSVQDDRLEQIAKRCEATKAAYSRPLPLPSD